MSQERLQVEFAVPHRYEVCFLRDATGEGKAWFDDLHREHGPFPKVIVLLDGGLAKARPDLVESWELMLEGLPTEIAGVHVFSGGEDIKNNREELEEMLALLETWGICRHSMIVAVGGGAFLDACGYAASITHRGVRMVRFPSTVLAQNDAGIGVKNGVNAFGKKNFWGVFQSPLAVFNDVTLLESLSERDRVAGLAEAIKVALLKDADFFDFLASCSKEQLISDTPQRHRMLVDCAHLHLKHIAGSGDPFEKGNSRPLDFGHWAAHKLEALSQHRLRHGEAVAIGLGIDIRYGMEMGWLPEEEGERIIETIAQLGLPLSDKLVTDELLEGLEEFREHLGGKLCIASIRRVGEPFDLFEVDDEVMKRVLSLS
jgi:3-dehydroquinate synthase